MKRITIDAGINSLEELKHIRQLQSDLYKWRFSLRKMPECIVKSEIIRVLNPRLNEVLRELKSLEKHFDKEEKGE